MRQIRPGRASIATAGQAPVKLEGYQFGYQPEGGGILPPPTCRNEWGGMDSNHRPADYESAKKEAIYQEERAEEARRPGLIVLTMIRKFPAVSNLEGYQLGYQYA